MAGNILGSVYGRADWLKRAVKDLLYNPGATAEQAAGQAQDSLGALRQGLPDPRVPLDAQPQSPAAIDKVLEAMMGATPAGVVRLPVQLFQNEVNPVQRFHRQLLGSVQERVRNKQLMVDQLKTAGQYQWDVGQQLYSPKTGRTWTITGLNVGRRGEPMYFVKSNDGEIELSSLFADKAHETLIPLGGKAAK